MIIDKNNYKELVSSKNKILKTKVKYYTLPKDKWYTSLREAVICIIEDINEQPRCYCGEYLSFAKGAGRYTKTCSLKCSRNKNRPPDSDAVELTKEALQYIFSINFRHIKIKSH